MNKHNEVIDEVIYEITNSYNLEIAPHFVATDLRKVQRYKEHKDRLIEFMETLKEKENFCSQCGANRKTEPKEAPLVLGDDLKVTHYQNGDPIPQAISNKQFIELGEAKIGCFSINDKGSYLYNWYAVNDKRNMCPKGWKIPTDEKWNKLKTQLKENPTYAGYRDNSNGNYYHVGSSGYFWSSTETNSYDVWSRNLYYDNSDVYRYPNTKAHGFSVRCVKEIK